jgi:hypothetical protein
MISEVYQNLFFLPGFSQGFDDETIGYIACRLRRATYSFGDYVYKRGDAAEDMYFITDGKVILSKFLCSCNPSMSGFSFMRRTSLTGHSQPFIMGSSEMLLIFLEKQVRLRYDGVLENYEELTASTAKDKVMRQSFTKHTLLL